MWIVAAPHVSFSLCLYVALLQKEISVFEMSPDTLPEKSSVMHKSKNHSSQAEDILFFLPHHTTLILLIQDSVLTWSRNLSNSGDDTHTRTITSPCCLVATIITNTVIIKISTQTQLIFPRMPATSIIHVIYFISYIFLHKLNFPRTGALALGQATANKIWWCPHLQEGVCSPNWHD